MSRTVRTAATGVAAVAVLTTPLATGGAQASPEPFPTIAFTSDRDGDTEIYLRSTDGSIRQLTRNQTDDYGAVWSPDGRRLAFVSTRDGDREIFVMGADGSGLRQLTRNSKASNGAPVSDQAPAWSPDGRMIAFASTRDGGEPEIYRMNADGSGQVRLTRTPTYVSNHTPSWSPGGHYIVFSSDRPGYDNYEVYRMRSNGSEQVRMTRTAAGVDDNAPEYSPDGRRIVFSSTRQGGQHDLFTMAHNSFDVRRLGGDPGLDEVFPRWTGNGRSVVYETFAGPDGVPSADAWIVDAGGTDARRILGTSAAESFPDPRPGG